MKLLFVTPYLYPAGGGVGRFAFNLAKEMSKKHKVVIVCSGKEDITEKQEAMDIVMLKPDFRIFNTPIRLNLFFELNNILKKDRFDVIQSFTPVPYFVDIASLSSRRYKIPFFVSYNTFSLYRKGNLIINSIVFFYKKILERITLTKAERIIFYNKNLSRALENGELLSEYTDKIVFVNPGIDSKIFKPAKRANENYIIYIGALNRWQSWKGVSYLLESIKILKDRGEKIVLKIVGPSDLFNHRSVSSYYADLVRKIGIEDCVEFCGFTNDKKIVDFLQNSYFLALPSYFNAELMPFVILEAFACGKSVISTTSGGIPYIVDNKIDGLLVSPRNSIQLADKISYLIDNKEIRKKMGISARNKVKSFSWQRTADEVLDIYEKYV